MKRKKKEDKKTDLSCKKCERVLILTEVNYLDSSWCDSIMKGLEERLKCDRIPYRQIWDIDEADDGSRFIFVIGSDKDWLLDATQSCNLRSIYPILLCNQSYHTFEANYSIVCSDIMGSMRHLINLLHERGKEHIAMYGVNPKSVADESRLEGFINVAGKPVGRGYSDIFFNNGSLEECFEGFLGSIHEYDAVICANDFVAISLIRRLEKTDRDILKNIMIVSCAESVLTRYTGRPVLSVKNNFEDYGSAAVSLYKTLRKNEKISHIIMMIHWDFSLLEQKQASLSHKARPIDGYKVRQQGIRSRDMHAQDILDRDRELNEMMMLEKLIADCEEEDFKIIGLLMSGKTYERIAEECFLTESTVKYRVKKMVQGCKAGGKKELIRLFDTYLSKETIYIDM